jgi:predicted nuclease of predicted toxin-antitoxin system
MKLLLDQNLSHKVVAAVADLFPESAHVRNFNLHRAGDEAVWDFARAHGYVIVSKDDDFHQRSFLLGHPPKVIWLRLGNCRTNDFIAVLRSHAADIVTFGTGSAESLLILG